MSKSEDREREREGAISRRGEENGKKKKKAIKDREPRIRCNFFCE